MHTLVELFGAGSSSGEILAPGRPALSHAELAGRVWGIASLIRQAGVSRADRVAVVLPNGPEMAIAFFGAACAAVCAPLNPAYRRSEFAFYFEDLRPKLLIVQKGVDSPARAVAAETGVRILELMPGMAASASPIAEMPEPDDVALVLHTSGTTSRPKIVPLTHANLCASARNIGRTLALTPRDRCLNVMPLFHIHGLIAALLAPLAAGGSVVCAPGFLAPEFFPWIDEFAPTWYSAVPTIHQGVLARAGEHRDIIARRPLRFLRSSSAPLPPSVMADLEAVFGSPVIEAYGMTEASHQMASNPLPPRVRKPGSVGLAAGPEIAILDECGAFHFNGPTPSGEIVIRGDNVTAGYENNPKANAEGYREGWFRTGDVGSFDAEGKSRVCEPGTVRVIRRRLIESYAGVFHTVDHVEGFLEEGFDSLDAFLSHMWAVTVIGAPKKAAAQTIESLEKDARGWYGGAVGMILLNGDINTGILIRTTYLHDGIASYPVGATLLYDSVPAMEEARRA